MEMKNPMLGRYALCSNILYFSGIMELSTQMVMKNHKMPAPIRKPAASFILMERRRRYRAKAKVTARKTNETITSGLKNESFGLTQAELSALPV